MRLKDMDDDSLRISEMQFSTTNSAGTVINLSSRFQRIDSMNKDEYIAQALSCRCCVFVESCYHITILFIEHFTLSYACLIALIHLYFASMIFIKLCKI